MWQHVNLESIKMYYYVVEPSILKSRIILEIWLMVCFIPG